MKLQFAILLTGAVALCTATANTIAEKEEQPRRLAGSLEEAVAGLYQIRLQGAIRELEKLQNELSQEQETFRQQKDWFKKFLSKFDIKTLWENEEDAYEAYEANERVGEMKETENRIEGILLKLKNLWEERFFFNPSSQNKSNVEKLQRLSLADIRKQLAALSELKEKRKSMDDQVKATGMAFQEKVEQLYELSETDTTRSQLESEVEKLQNSVKVNEATIWNLNSEGSGYAKDFFLQKVEVV